MKINKKQTKSGALHYVRKIHFSNKEKQPWQFQQSDE